MDTFEHFIKEVVTDTTVVSHCGHDRRVSSTRPLRYVKIRFFSVMRPKDPAPFSYISHKKPSFDDKVRTYYRILVSKRVKSRQTGKKWTIDTTVVSIVHLWTIHDGRVRRVKYKGHDGRVRNIHQVASSVAICHLLHLQWRTCSTLNCFACHLVNHHVQQ